MGLTAWAQEEKAKHEAWRENRELQQSVAALQAENAKLKDKLADYEGVLRYVKNNKSGHGFRINSVFSKWSKAND